MGGDPLSDGRCCGRGTQRVEFLGVALSWIAIERSMQHDRHSAHRCSERGSRRIASLLAWPQNGRVRLALHRSVFESNDQAADAVMDRFFAAAVDAMVMALEFSISDF